MAGQLLQFGGSLAAILALFLIARWLGLGAANHIASVDHAKALAAETDLSFAPVSIAIDTAGAAALLVDGEGNVMLLMPHGNRHVGRILTTSASATCDNETISVHTGERTHRMVTLNLNASDAAAWRDRIGSLQ